MQWFEVGEYIQKATKKEITCTCIWSTFELSRYPKQPELRKDCKHIKEVRIKLGQEEVYILLKKNGGWMTTKQLSTTIDTGRGTISLCANKLFKIGYIDRRRIKNIHNINQYEYKVK